MQRKVWPSKLPMLLAASVRAALVESNQATCFITQTRSQPLTQTLPKEVIQNMEKAVCTMMLLSHHCL